MAGRTCTVCVHAERTAIDQALVERRGSIRDIARQHGLTKDAVARHLAVHVSESLLKAKDAVEVTSADNLLDRVNLLVEDAKRLQGKAEKAGDLRTALTAVREQTRIVELLARLLGELGESSSTTTVNVAVVQTQLSADELEHLADLARQEAEELRASATVTTIGHSVADVGRQATAPSSVE